MILSFGGFTKIYHQLASIKVTKSEVHFLTLKYFSDFLSSLENFPQGNHLKNCKLLH